MSYPAYLSPLLLIPTAIPTAIQLWIPMIAVILLPISVNQLQMSANQQMSQSAMPPKRFLLHLIRKILPLQNPG